MPTIFINTVIRGSHRYIRFTEEEQDGENFRETFVNDLVVRAFDAHKTEFSDEVKIEFLDKHKTPLDADDLFDLTSQFTGCACFFIELKILGESTKSITAEQLQNYLVLKKNAQFLLTEQAVSGSLNKPSRLRLITYLTNLIDDEYGGSASLKEIRLICEATIALFPSLADSCGGISMLYAPPKGFLFNKLRNQKRHNHPQCDQNQNETDWSDEENSLENENNLNLMQYFKNCVVMNSKSELKVKLADSVEFRRRILMNPREPIHAIFPFYFVDTELIQFDFGLLFKDIDAGSLFGVWPTIRNKPRELYGILLDEDVMEATNDPNILDFLRLLKFIPARRVLFSNAMKQFLVFSKDQNEEPMKLMQPSNPHPVIIVIVAKVPVPDVKYYIGWQDRIFSVPKEFNFVQVMDLFYKIHKVFNLNFNNKIKSMMSFIDHFIFKFPETHLITPTIQEASIKLLRD